MDGTVSALELVAVGLFKASFGLELASFGGDFVGVDFLTFSMFF